MSQPNAVPQVPKQNQSAQPILNKEHPIARLAHIIGQASRFAGDEHGLDNGERAALARLSPEGELRPHQIAALSRALILAGLDPGAWKPETWRRWAIIVHGMALTGHDPDQSLGQQLSKADVSALRVTKLLTARGVAFFQMLPSLLRLLASRGIAPNWNELGDLILNQDRDEKKAEDIRLKIAGRFFSSEAKKSKH